MGRDSLLIVVIGCWLYDQGLWHSMEWEFSHCYDIQTCTGPCPILYTAGTSGSFTWLRHDVNHFPLSCVEVKNVWSFSSTLIIGCGHFLRCSGLRDGRK
jgi:hypothetical protein